MQKRSEKKVSYRQRLARFVAPVGGRTWRALIWQLVLVLLMFFSFAGQDAQAVNAYINQTLEKDRNYEFNINESITLGGYCYPGDEEYLKISRWNVEDSAGNEIYFSDIPLERLPGFLLPWKLVDTAKPGEKYTYSLACKTSTYVWQNHTVSRHFSVRSLEGSYKAVVDTSNNLLVTGTVGNGANSVSLYFVDASGKETFFTGETHLTSRFEIKQYLPYGVHQLRVYAEYRTVDKTYSESLGTSQVASRPGVGMDKLPRFTNDSEIKLSGYANSPEGIRERKFQGKDKQGMEYELPYDFSTRFLLQAQEKADLKQTVTVQNDGLYTFQYWAGSTTGQVTTSDWQSTVLDRKPPDVNDVSPSATSYLKRNQTFTANVIDLDKTGEAGSGLKSVQLGYKDKTGGFSWLTMPLGTGGNYSVDIPFDALPIGENRFKVWTQDRAKNIFETSEMSYQKAPPPKVEMDTPLSPTKISKFNITGHAKSDAGLQRAEITWWKEGELNNKHSVALRVAGTEDNINHEIELPEDGKYLVQLSATSVDGQSFLAKPQEVLLDTTKPVITLVSPEPDSLIEKDFTLKFRVEDAGVGIADVQIQVGKGNPEWIENIQHDGAGNYWQELQLDAFDAGTTIVSIWAKDKFDHQEWIRPVYTKEVQAADALDATLSILAADGGVPKEAFYADQERVLRLSVKPVTAIDKLAIDYQLPDGLARRNVPSLRDSAGMSSELKSAINAQLSNWSGSGALLTSIDLPKGQTLELDIPVKIDLSTPSLKSGGIDALTAFEVSGGNITDTTRAETNWRADWKKAPADVNNPLVTNFDLSAASIVSIFDNISGGYDTATPEKWNRNTLRCADSNVQCQDHAGNNDTSIKLLFTEAASKKTVTLALKGQRQLSLISGGMRNTPLGSPDNAGADAEARFSVSLPKEELAKLPAGGQWSAALDMALQDFGGARQAHFRSKITLNVTDATGMAMTPPQMQLLPGSHQDLDNSGGFSAGDELTYRISYHAARDLSDVQLDYDLPPGLERSDVAATFADGSDIRQQEKLRKDGGKALLENGVALKKGDTLIIDVPLRIEQSSELQIVSQVSARADGYGAMTSAKALLQVQQRFQAEQALTLTFDMAAADKAGQAGGTGATVAHKAPFVYRITLTAQKQAVKNASLLYRLPGGLSRTDAPIVIKGPATALLNAQWNGDADDELLAANSDLSPGESLTLDIPILVKDAVGDGVSVKSTVNAGAGNLSDGLQATHIVKAGERLNGNDRVMVVKSSDANAEVQPGASIAYQIRVSNQTSKTVRNLLIRDSASDHTEMAASSCGELPAETCSTFTLNDSDIVEGQMTHDALCKTPDRKSVPGGRHVFWCLNGDLDPLDDYVVDYTLKVNGDAPQP